MTHQRRYDIDWLRVIAIFLLLIYHIAIVFQPWAIFIGFVRSDDMLEQLWVPMSFLNVWRIPLLFFVSGMGVYFAMQRRSIKELLLDRAKRILFPYLFGIVAIVPLHIFIFQKFYNQPLTYMAHPAHLWFLGNMVIYLSILFPLFRWLVLHPKNKFKILLNRLFRNPIGIFSITVFFVLEALILDPHVFSMYAQSLHGYAIGFLAFLFGFILVYAGETFWPTVSKWKYLYLGLAVSLFVIRLTIFGNSSPNYLLAIESNLWIFSLFGLASSYLNRPSKSLSYFSDAVYPVYIIHMAVLYGVSTLVLPLAIDPFPKFVLIVVATGLSCWVLYEFVIKKVSFLRVPFGMRPKRMG
ncbi:MAG TPA: acyltransferase family protein [Cryomorphaceae bacterium]|nr:acyltransferase family protein [Cryomorphaceae bacterium]